MNKKMFSYQKTVLVGLVLLLALSAPVYAIEDALIAIVNDELITLKDLKDYIHGTYISLVAEGIEEDQLTQIVRDLEINGLDKLIEDKLILSKANDVGLSIHEKAVEERVAQVKSRYASEDEFTEALINHGATLTDLKKKMRDQLKITYIIEHEVKSKIYVNPQEVTKFYETNPDIFKREERANLESIYIAFGDDKPAARKKAQEALDLLLQGTPFLEVAEKYSDTPSIGTIKRGEVRTEIEEAVFRLREDEISPLVEVDTGIYIFQLNRKIPAQIASLKEVKDSVYNLLYKKKFKEQFTQWLEKLKEDAYIEIKK